MPKKSAGGAAAQNKTQFFLPLENNLIFNAQQVKKAAESAPAAFQSFGI